LCLNCCRKQQQDGCNKQQGLPDCFDLRSHVFIILGGYYILTSESVAYS
jgi:hypothetical protein